MTFERDFNYAACFGCVGVRARRCYFADEDSFAYSFLYSMSVTEEQVNELGSRINVTRCSIEGASDWLEDNWEVVESWIQASEKIENT